MPDAPTPSPAHWVIGFNWLIDRQSTQRLLTAVGIAIEKGARGITICISSTGGSPDQASYAYEILTALPADISLITHNVATVQSAAMTIFLAGRTRRAVKNSTFMVHRTFHNTGGPVGAEHVEYGADSIKADDVSAMAIVAERTGKDPSDVRKWFRGQKLRSTTFAMEKNIITEVRSVEFPPSSAFFQIVL